jgi:hypothetical protein
MIRYLKVRQKRFALKTNAVVVLSLTQSRASLLMWAHYAAQHTGLVIGFDADGEILKSASPYRQLRKVVYAPNRPSGSTEADLTNEQVLLTKGEEWAYEGEWRIIDSLYAADGEGDFHHWPFYIRPESVRELVLGCRCDAHTERDAVAALKRDELRHVALYKAVPDERRFGLNFIEESPRGSRVVVLL